MKAIFKRELKAYYTSVIGWIFYAAFFFIFNLYFYAYNLSMGYPYISYTLSSIIFVFLIIVPILTMRSMSEDRKTKTDQLLYTAPVSVEKVILGKFLAMLAVFSIAMGIVCILPILLSRFGTVPMAHSYTAILGVWLYGALCISIGLFMSALTESQVIAAVLSFAVLFLGYMMDSIINLVSTSSNWLTKVLGCLSITKYVNNFTSGIVDVTGIIYYVTAAALFLFLTSQLVQKHRWSSSSKKLQRGVFNSSFIVIGIAIVVVVNVFANELPDSVKNIDVTNQKLYTLTQDTYDLLDTIDQEVDIYVLNTEDAEDSTVVKTLERYEDGSDNIKVTYIDPAISPNFYQSYTDTAPSDGSLIVVCGENSKVVDINDMYEYSYDYTNQTTKVSGYDGEGQITSAISMAISGDVPVVYVIDGHGENSLDSSFSDALTKLNVDVENITLLQQDAIPEDAAGVIINGPTSDFSEEDAQKLSDYLAGGGYLLMMTSYEKGDTPNLDAVLAEYNIEIESGIIMESDQNMYYSYPFYLLPTVKSDDAGITSGVDQYVFVPYAQAIKDTSGGMGTTEFTDLLTTSSSAYRKADVENITTYDQEEDDESGQFTIAANIVDEETGANITIIGSSVSMTDDADSVVSGQNLALFKGVIKTFPGSDSSVSIDAKDYTLDNLTVTQFASIFGMIGLVIILPVVLIVLGIVIWYRRRKA